VRVRACVRACVCVCVCVTCFVCLPYRVVCLVALIAVAFTLFKVEGAVPSTVLGWGDAVWVPGELFLRGESNRLLQANEYLRTTLVRNSSPTIASISLSGWRGGLKLRVWHDQP